jgi:HK97 family phage major capsid protein
MNEYLKLVSEAEAAFEAGDIEKADELTAKAEKVKENLERGDKVKALKADAEARQAAKEKEEKKRREAEIQAEVDKRVEEATKNLGVQRPEYGDGEPPDTAPTDPSLFLSRLSVMSKYDNLPLTEMAVKYQIQRLSHRAGRSQAPSQKLYRALCVKANRFLRTEDELARLDAYGKPFKMTVPAFDPELLGKWGEQGREEDTIEFDGVKLNTYGQKGITREGIDGLIKLAKHTKANELVHSTQSNYGDEWVPTLMDAVLWRTVRLESSVLSVLPQFDMTSNPQDVSIESTDPTFYLVGETTAETQMALGSGMPIPDSKIGTAKTTFSANKIGAITMWSAEQAEDSPVNIETQFRDQYGVSMAHAINDVLINGDETTDTTNISYQGTSLTANSRYLAVDGLRHEPMVTTTADKRSVGALTVDDVVGVRKLMGTDAVFGADTGQLVIFCDPTTGLQFTLLDEVSTVDKFGSGATILTGQLGSVTGIPIMSVQKYQLTDADGNIDDTAADNVKGSFLVVNRLGVRVGWRRRPRMVVGQVPFSDAWYILTLARLDIGFKEAGMVGLGYNITV